MFEIKYADENEIQDYSHISDALISDCCLQEWFDSPNPLMGTPEININVYDDIEGDFVYDNKPNYDEES
jgi:hypothetical protein